MSDYDYADDYYKGEIADDGVEIIDPGAPLFLETLLFCVCSLLALPIFVAIGNRRARLRRARKEWRNRGGDQYNLDTFVSDRSSFDEASADGCRGCNAIEEMLEVGDMGDIGCCIAMCDNQLAVPSVNDTSDNFVQPQHLGNESPRPSTEQYKRKRKSMSDIPYNNAFDESKRTRRHIPDDASFVRLAQQHSFSVGVDDEQHASVPPSDPPDPPSPKVKNNSPKVKKKKKKKKRLYKRAVKAVTKKQPIRPLSQTPLIPKVTFLDGGFYAPGNLRLHHQVLKSQLDIERRASKKRRKEKKAKSYVPPSIPTTNTAASLNRRVSFDQISVDTSTSSNHDDEEFVYDLDLVFGLQSPYHPNKRKKTWDHVVRIAKFDHESKRIVNLMAPYTSTALICNMFAIIDIAIISSVLGAESLSAFLVVEYFLRMLYKAVKGFTDAQATLCAHAVGAGNYFLAGQYIQLTQIVFVLTGFLPLFLMGSFMYQLLVWLDVSSDVATLGGNFATVQVIALLFGGFNDAHIQFLNAIDPSIYSNVIESLMHACYTAGISGYLYYNTDATLVDLAWIQCSVAVLFIPVNITALKMRGWLDLCWVGMVRSNALKNIKAVKQMFKTGVPLGIGSLIRESEWGLLVLFASYIGTDDVATFAVVRRTSDIFSSLIEGLCLGAELRCAYHMGRGNQQNASTSAYKSLIIGISFGTALAFAFYGLLGNFVFNLLDYDHIGADMTQLIPLLCLCNIVMTIGMLGWALLGAQGQVRLATFVTFASSWIVTIPIAAFFVLVRNYNLQGLVAAVTMGYSVSSTIIMYLLIRSNWKKRSAKVLRSTSFTAASFADDESTLSSKCSDNDILEPAPVKSMPIEDLTLSIPSILGVDSDVMEMANQLDEAVQLSIPT